MANYSFDRRRNNLLNYRNRYYNLGGTLNNIFSKVGNFLNTTDDKGNIISGAFKDMSKGTSNIVSGLTKAAGTALGNSISGGLESGAGNVIEGLANVASVIPGPTGAIISAGLNTVGGLVDRAFGSKLNEDNISAVEETTKNLKNFQSNANSFDTLANTWGTTSLGSNFSNNYIGKDGWLSNKAKKKANNLREDMQLANANVENALQNNANNITQNIMNTLNANYAAFGGTINSNGINFPTGLSIINSGGTHESNPLEGVPISVDEKGNPNLVEEGEAIYNDYVFSNRLTVPKSIRSKYKLKGSKDLTFADAVKQLSKSVIERPNDSISKDTLNDAIADLAVSQELDKIKNVSKVENYTKNSQNNKFLDGGKAVVKLTPDFTSMFYKTTWPSVVDSSLLSNVANKPIPEVPVTPSINKVAYEPLAVTTDLNQLGLKDYINSNKIEAPTLIMPTPKEKNTTNIHTSSTNLPAYSTNLRYTPAYGLGVSVLTDALGITNTPDYGAARQMEAAIDNASYLPVNWTPVGNKLVYTPFDRDYYSTQLGAQANATRRSILNNSGGNRGTALAAMLAADYNAQGKLGELYRQAAEYNDANRKAVADFNRSTNIANSNGMLQADTTNAGNYANSRQVNLNMIANAAQARANARAIVDANKSSNLSNFITTLGDIGKENLEFNMVNSNKAQYYGITRDGQVFFKNNAYNADGTLKQEAIKEISKNSNQNKTTSNAYGGMLTKKSKTRR